MPGRYEDCPNGHDIRGAAGYRTPMAKLLTMATTTTTRLAPGRMVAR